MFPYVRNWFYHFVGEIRDKTKKFITYRNNRSFYLTVNVNILIKNPNTNFASTNNLVVLYLCANIGNHTTLSTS